jgi:hypothetical protein
MDADVTLICPSHRQADFNGPNYDYVMQIAEATEKSQ